MKWLVTILILPRRNVLLFSAKRSKPSHPVLLFDGTPIEEVSQHKHLGVTLTNNLSWKPHMLQIDEIACMRLNMLKGIQFKVDRQTLCRLYISL